MNTKLEIINAMLSTVGLRRINELTSHPSVSQAMGLLDDADRDFQNRGWWFNRETNITILQDDEGKIVIPDTFMSIYLNVPNERYLQMGNWLYDNYKHTYIINEPITLNAIIRRPVEYLSSVPFNVLKKRAVRDMCIAWDVDNLKMQMALQGVDRAETELLRDELRYTQTNVFNSPGVQAFQYRIGSTFSPSNPYYPGGRQI